MNIPFKTALPENSQIEPRALGAYFYDAWSVQAAMADLDPLAQFIRVAKKTPSWIDLMMVLRNRVVQLFGLKNVGVLSDIDPSKPSADYKVGERVGVFTLLENSENEVLLGDEDNHLSVVVSIHKKRNANDTETMVTVSTVVHIKNWMGRLYMLPVAPVHHVIAKRMTGAMGNAL
ncbi:DUF2867 domain-containing protein [Marinomonas balearica]|uniref:Uncharacterized protein DUF2867 n=1 Tax=Marinomonas balearica TaxID=491947 RepID=A0A4R6MCR1_9GAMM|nr:DUF2867 domain-containing protein [Marinomonas balearica]TDO98965.1 uncharacterized protein DUF2867 [Marinomonas balearica]